MVPAYAWGAHAIEVQAVTGIGGDTRELAALWPALSAALARDTAAADMPGAHAWMTRLVNENVHAAMLTLQRDVPATTRRACETIGEMWQHRDVPQCLTALPRLAERLGHVGFTAEQARVTSDVRDWVRLTKRALGLRKPDLPVGYKCPYAASVPEDHVTACMLFAAGQEGFLQRAEGGWRVVWVVQERIYCASEDCEEGPWPMSQWAHLGRLLQATARVAS